MLPTWEEITSHVVDPRFQMSTPCDTYDMRRLCAFNPKQLKADVMLFVADRETFHAFACWLYQE